MLLIIFSIALGLFIAGLIGTLIAINLESSSVAFISVALSYIGGWTGVVTGILLLIRIAFPAFGQ